MDEKTRKKIDVNIKTLKKELDHITEDKLEKREFIILEFQAIRALIDDIEKIILNDKGWIFNATWKLCNNMLSLKKRSDIIW